MASQVLEEMVIKISAETGNLQTEMAKVKAQLEKVGSTAKTEASHTREMGEAFKEVAKRAVEFLALREVAKFVAEAGHAAVENSKSFEIMARTLQTATGASREEADAVDKQIESLSSMSNVVASQIRPSFDVLVRSTKDSAAALQLQKLALDVSAGTGKDLATVSLALSKAYEGQGTALNRLVPSVRNSTDKFAELQKQFGGTAATAANADPYSKMKNAMEQIQVAVGKDLLPILQKFADWMSGAVPQIQAFFTALSDPTTQLGAQFAQLTGTIEGAFGFITSNIGTILQLAIAFGSVAAVIGTVQAAMTAYQTVLGIVTTAQALFDVALGAINPVALAIGLVVLTAGVIGIGTAAITAANQVGSLNSALGSLGGNPEDKFGTQWSDRQMFNSGIINKWAKEHGEARTKAINDQALYLRHRAVVAKGEKQYDTEAFESGKALFEYQTKMMADYDKAQKAKTPAGIAQIATSKAAADAKAKADNAAAQAQADKLAAVAKKHNEDLAKAHQALADKLQSIMSKSLQSLRDAFVSATKVDIGDMFKTMQDQGEASADSLLASLKDRLAQIRQLAQDTAKLAGAGFSELFIQQVVSQGPEVGNALAQSILGASAQTQNDLKTTFAQSVQLGSGSFITGSKTNLSTKQLLALGDSQGGQAVVGSSSTVTVNAPINVQTNASPAQIAQATISAIKFGLPIGATS